VVGDALDASSFAYAIPADATLIHLVGTPRPSPAKAAEFHRVDVPSIKATTAAAQQRAIRHLIYVSVAHPAPVMHAYIAAREEGEHVAATRAGAERLGLVTLEAMIAALVNAVETPPTSGVRIIEVPEIRRFQ
jgi:hypothetical protein